MSIAIANCRKPGDCSRTNCRCRHAAAADRTSEITLVAVTKYVAVDVARQLVTAGCRDLGESRPQELWAKAESLQ